MSIISKTVEELRQGLQNKEFSSREITTAYLQRIEEVDSIINAYITITPEVAIQAAEEADERRSKGMVLSPIDGIPMGVKDSICTRGVLTSAGSKMLYNFVPPYDGVCWQRLQKAGAVLTGKTNMDEFGAGSSTESSAYGATRNPFAIEHIPGGSSGGSAAAVAADMAAYALGVDSGGSIRQPAHFCGVVGVRPSYGRVSRFGIIPYTSSMDQAGIIGKTVRDTALILELAAGHDSADSTSVQLPVGNYRAACDRSVKGMKIGIPSQVLGEGVGEETLQAINRAAAMLREMGAIVEEVSLPHTSYALAAYCILSSAEASSNMSRYDGVNFGLRVERDNTYDMMTATRGEGFGKEIKTRILLGTYMLSSEHIEAYYNRTMQVRTLVKGDYEKVFAAGFDCLLSPVAATTAPKLGEGEKDTLSLHMTDYFTVPASLSGLPGISVPFSSHEGLPLGLQVIGRPFGEEAIFSVAAAIEQPRLLPPDIKAQAQGKGVR